MDAEPVTARELLDAARTRLSKAMRAATDQDAAHSTFIAVGQLLEALVVLEERVSRVEAPATPADTSVPEAVNQSRDTTAPDRPAWARSV